jgi:N4-(beta-N-acetylglucosaminyl)-L-asparaginase
MAFKMRGRVGDSPIIGAGLYVDQEVGAVVCTGQGEEVIRVAGAHLAVEFMRDGLNPTLACRKVIDRIVSRDKQKAKDFQVGLLALDPQGNYGAFAVHPGFNYAITNGEASDVILDAESYF